MSYKVKPLEWVSCRVDKSWKIATSGVIVYTCLTHDNGVTWDICVDVKDLNGNGDIITVETGFTSLEEVQARASKLHEDYVNSLIEPVSPWRPIEECPCEKDRMYFVYAVDSVYRAEYLNYADEWLDQGGRCRCYGVTHYMEIPELPDEVK